MPHPPVANPNSTTGLSSKLSADHVDRDNDDDVDNDHNDNDNDVACIRDEAVPRGLQISKQRQYIKARQRIRAFSCPELMQRRSVTTLF